MMKTPQSRTALALEVHQRHKGAVANVFISSVSLLFLHSITTTTSGSLAAKKQAGQQQSCGHKY